MNNQRFRNKVVLVTGGGDLAGQFHDQGLLDELILSVAPDMLEGGAPLLPRDITAPPMKLIDVEQFEDVFAVLTYSV
jgi:dihydrofolate reductase